MGNKSKEVDAYIAKSAEFARPILTRIRAAFHKACPDIEETIKWSMPHFEYKGIVANMAAFKAHVRFGFWKSKLMSDADGLFTGMGKTPMNMLKITSASELPKDKALIAYIKEAVRLNEGGVKPPQSRTKTTNDKKEIEVPIYFIAELKNNKKALKTFDSFSPTNRKEYVEWITEAKQDATRQRRIATAIAWLAEGKPRNWKYMKEWR